MTRINTVDPAILRNPHLLAEYRELPRVFALSSEAQKRGLKRSTIPKSYRMGKGHVLFFYDKLGYLVARQETIIRELSNRGFKLSFTNPLLLLTGNDPEWINDWYPTRKDHEVNLARLSERNALL